MSFRAGLSALPPLLRVMSSSSTTLDFETDMERQSSPATSLNPGSSLAPSPPPLSDYSRASSEAGPVSSFSGYKFNNAEFYD